MLISLLQAAPMNINFNLQAEGIDLGALGEQSTIPSALMPAMFGILIFGAIVMVIVIAVSIINLINIYHWGMTEDVEFKKIGHNKKKWYFNLIIVPIVLFLINLIPGLGQLISLIIFFYWIFVVLQYFFKIKGKIAKPTETPPEQANPSANA